MISKKRKLIESAISKIVRRSILEFDESYDGFSNFDTWAVSTYLNNERPIYNLLQKHHGNVSIPGLKALVNGQLKRLNPEGFAEINQKKVNWQEVADDENS